MRSIWVGALIGVIGCASEIPAELDASTSGLDAVERSDTSSMQDASDTNPHSADSAADAKPDTATDAKTDTATVDPAMSLGVYGRSWTTGALQKPKAFDFIHYQVRYFTNGEVDPLPIATMTDQTQKLRKIGLEIVLEILFYVDKNQRAAKDGAPALQDPLYYREQVFGRVLDQLDPKDIRHVTIEEENIWWKDQNPEWPNRADFLSTLYQKLKNKYPAFSFAQWYSPSKKINIPGQGAIPEPKADAWIFDQYHLTDGDYDTYINGMIGLNKPLGSIVWASPNWQVGGDGTPNTTWWDASGWKTFYKQVIVNRSHKIPTALFIYGLGCPGTKPLYDCGDPCAQKFLDKLVNTTLPYLRSPSSQPSLLVPTTRPSWIPGHCGQ